MLYNLKNLFVGVSCESNWTDESSAVAYGLSLAQAAAARLTVQSASQKLFLPHGRLSDVVAGMVSAENARLQEVAGKIADDTRAAAELAGISCRTEAPHMSHVELVTAFLSEARVHDLTIIDAESSPWSPDRAIIEAAVFESGRPVLVVPPGTAIFKADRVLVAWDGSARAARALNDALPILKAAALVEVVSVQGEKDLAGSVPGAELASHLSSHGVTFIVTDLAVVGRDVAQTLRDHATSMKADMIVMGAYVHSWFRQVALGGVTQSLLAASPVPLYLSY